MNQFRTTSEICLPVWMILKKQLSIFKNIVMEGILHGLEFAEKAPVLTWEHEERANEKKQDKQCSEATSSVN